jgi:hypothetical protein
MFSHLGCLALSRHRRIVCHFCKTNFNIRTVILNFSLFDPFSIESVGKLYYVLIRQLKSINHIEKQKSHKPGLECFFNLFVYSFYNECFTDIRNYLHLYTLSLHMHLVLTA